MGPDHLQALVELEHPARGAVQDKDPLCPRLQAVHENLPALVAQDQGLAPPLLQVDAGQAVAAPLHHQQGAVRQAGHVVGPAQAALGGEVLEIFALPVKRDQALAHAVHHIVALPLLVHIEGHGQGDAFALAQQAEGVLPGRALRGRCRPGQAEGQGQKDGHGCCFFCRYHHSLLLFV